MELNITAFFNAAIPLNYSASQVEMVADADPRTWRNAVEADFVLLDTDEKREAFRDFVRSAGWWDGEEIAAWSDNELNALCIQWISGDMREPVDFELGPDTTSEQWAEYEAQSEAGQVSGRIFQGIDGQIYFYCGS